jgi:putative spermidine/putrescine transport system permease protein
MTVVDEVGPYDADAPAPERRRTAAPLPEAAAPSRFRLSQAVNLLLWVIVLVLAIVPLGLVLAISFGQKIEGAGWEWDFTFANYLRFFVGASWPEETTFLYVTQLYWALRYAVIASILAVITALPFTYLMTRLPRAAQARWLVFLLASLSLSEVFIVMGWDIILSNNSGLPALFAATGLTDWLKGNGWFEVLREWGLANPRNVKFKTSEVATVLTMSYLVWPYAVILLYPALSRLDPSLAEAARTMGARPWTVTRTVILPSVRLPLMGTTLLLFVFLMGSYIAITVFADPSKQTTAVSVYEHVRGSTLNAPFGAAQSVILLITALVFLVLGQRLSRAGKGAV